MSHVLPGFAVLLLGILACEQDEAQREYFAALRADEDGSTAEEQLAHFDRAIELAPDRSEYRESRAIALIDRRDFVRALSDLDAAIALRDRPYLRFLRGLVLCQQGRFEESLVEFDTAIEKQPDNTQFYRGRGLARAEAGQLVAAWEDAVHLIEHGPQRAESYYVRARVHVGFGRYAEARADLDRAIEIRPDLIYPRTLRVECLRLLGESDQAAEAERDLTRRLGQGIEWAGLDPFRY